MLQMGETGLGASKMNGLGFNMAWNLAGQINYPYFSWHFRSIRYLMRACE